MYTTISKALKGFERVFSNREAKVEPKLKMIYSINNQSLIQASK